MMTHLYKSVPVRSSEITPKQVYLSRRDFIKATGLIAGSMALAACAPAAQEEAPAAKSIPASTAADDLGDTVNTYEDITNYNNYYEFTTDKQGVAALAKDFKTAPWTVEVGGLVKNPKTF
ncbi:MAG: twin-arginine translocation signal domain-containing protein, partial [Anaerolineales bacterium]|nr:twin-arginine translocation signal domain-containing protein [Anaerolineales bacterium]